MDWLKELIKSLPLEAISEVLARLVLWWTRLVDGVPESQLPILAYIGATVLVLGLLPTALKILPKVMRGIVWVLSASVLLTPAGTMNDAGGSAPAIIGVIHSVLMGQIDLALAKLLPILAAAVILLVIGGLLQLIYAIILTKFDSNHTKSNQNA